MNETVHCIVLGEEAEALTRQPWPGALGKRILEQVSKPAWLKWMNHQTMLINEHRLNPLNPEHRAFIEVEMEKYFFGEGSETPAGFVPEDQP